MNKKVIKSASNPVKNPTIGPKINPVILIGNPIIERRKLGKMAKGANLTPIINIITAIDMKIATKEIFIFVNLGMNFLLYLKFLVINIIINYNLKIKKSKEIIVFFSPFFLELNLLLS